MDATFHQEWLINKFGEIQRRISKAMEQLSDEQLCWKPNEESHSIASLIRHIEGNILERIGSGILGQPNDRNRDHEFAQVPATQSELLSIIQTRFDFIIHSIAQMTEEDFRKTQIVRNKQRTNMDMLHQCAAHYSEHMGQIFYIAKLCVNENYRSTSL